MEYFLTSKFMGRNPGVFTSYGGAFLVPSINAVRRYSHEFWQKKIVNSVFHFSIPSIVSVNILCLIQHSTLDVGPARNALKAG
jgi:hypothetical protein